jgi:AraC-like DNA-binding protein
VMGCSIPFLAEYSVALPLLHLGRESQGSVRGEWASFRHIPEDVADLSSAFGCEVRVGQTWNGFALSRAAWQCTMPRRDPVLLRLLERQADTALSSLPPNPTLAEQVRRALTNGLAEGDASIEAIARSLAIAPRTLQRRLALERTTFQRVQDAVRRELAETHLRRSILSITEIAFVLGYSEPAAFHRAFRRWHGVTPQAFRAGLSGR